MRKEQQVALVREAILDAATRCFAGQGYNSVTMRDVAREAGYTAPTLYNYFKNKEELVEALVERVQVSFRAAFDEPTATGMTFRQKLELLVRRQREVAERNRDAFLLFMRLQSGGGSESTERLMALRAQGFRGYLDRLAAWIEASSEPAERGGRDPKLLAQFLWGIVHALHVCQFATDPNHQPGKQPDQTDIIIDLFFHGAGAPPKSES